MCVCMLLESLCSLRGLCLCSDIYYQWLSARQHRMQHCGMTSPKAIKALTEKRGKRVRELFPDASHVCTFTSETRFCEIVNDSFKHRIFQKITQILFWQSKSLLGHVRPSKTLSLQLIVSRIEEKKKPLHANMFGWVFGKVVIYIRCTFMSYY